MELQRANKKPFSYRNIVSETNGKPTYSPLETAYGNIVMSGSVKYTEAGVVTIGDARIYISISNYKKTGIMVGSLITIGQAQYTVENIEHSFTSVKLILRKLWT